MNFGKPFLQRLGAPGVHSRLVHAGAIVVTYNLLGASLGALTGLQAVQDFFEMVLADFPRLPALAPAHLRLSPRFVLSDDLEGT